MQETRVPEPEQNSLQWTSQVKLIGKEGILCDTPWFPVPPGRVKRCWTGGKEGRGKRFAVVVYFLLFVFVCFIFLNFHLQGGEQDREELRGGVHDVKFPKIPQRNYVLENENRKHRGKKD